MYGVVFAVIFTTGFGFITKGQAPYSFAFRQLLKVSFVVFSCWITGGLLAVFLAALSPDFYKSHFPLTPSGRMDMIKFAWVGGSIWGGEIGGLLGVILGVLVTKNSWAKELETM